MKIILISLTRFLFIISKTQLLVRNDKINLAFKWKFLGYILALFFYPKAILKKPRKKIEQRLASCFELLGPIYIKFGQTLSTRPDLIGEELSRNLRYLQDKLPPFDYEIVVNCINKSFGKDIKDIFSHFDKKPVAAASISQVHKARLMNGDFVAVKILRPKIHEEYNNDIIFFYFLAKLFPKFFPKCRRLRILEIVDLFKKTMNIELNLRLEAANLSEMQDNIKNSDIYIPKIYWGLTNEDILTTEWVDGISIYDSNKLIEANINPTLISEKIAIMFFDQAYRDGFFHADLHPGNILVSKAGKIILLDFGIVGRLEEDDRLAIAEILFSFLKRDYKKVAEIHLKAGYIPKNTDINLFAQRCRMVAEPIIGLAIKDISISNLLMQLFKITEDFGMETQPQLLLLQKTMVVVEGIGKSLNTNINMWLLAEPWMKKWARKNLVPEAKILRIIKKFLQSL